VSTGPALVVAVLLLGVNGFFVAVEFAMVGARRTKLAAEAAEAASGGRAGDARAAHALAAVGDLNRQLAGAQLGITMASLGLGIVAEPAVAGLFDGIVGHAVAVVLALAIVVFLHLVVGEMVPKTIALTDPERWLLRLQGANRAYLWLFGPVIRVLNGAANGVLRLVGVSGDEGRGGHTAAELAVMLAASRNEGLIEDFAHDLMAGVLDFGDRTAASVMVPRHRVVSIALGTTVADAERLVVESGHSRLPVIGADLDDVRGFVHSKDLLVLGDAATDRPVPIRLLRRMLVVRPERSLDDLLLAMRRARVHVAVVRDDEGRTLGLVTLEDLLEALVGDIADESDPTHRHQDQHQERHQDQQPQ
jgi:CBS domain containing-hemolysin-like protein